MIVPRASHYRRLVHQCLFVLEMPRSRRALCGLDGVPRTCKFTCPSQVSECRCMCHHNVFTTRTPCVDKLECKPGWTVTQLPGWHWTALLQSSDSHPSLRCFRKSESTHLAVLMQLSSGTLRFFVHPVPLLSQLIMNTPHLPFLRLLT